MFSPRKNTPILLCFSSSSSASLICILRCQWGARLWSSTYLITCFKQVLSPFESDLHWNQHCYALFQNWKGTMNHMKTVSFRLFYSLSLERDDDVFSVKEKLVHRLQCESHFQWSWFDDWGWWFTKFTTGLWWSSPWYWDF